MGGANAGKGKYIPPHRRGLAKHAVVDKDAGAGAGAGKYIPPHMRAGGAMMPKPKTFDPDAPTPSSFLLGKGFKKGASGYYYPDATTRPHIHVYVDTKGKPDFSSLTMVALSSEVSGAGGKDAGLTVHGHHKMRDNGYNRKRLNERLGKCTLATKLMWAEVMKNI